MKIKVWPNGMGAEVTIKSRRVSIQEHGSNGFAVPGQSEPWPLLGGSSTVGLHSLEIGGIKPDST